MLEDHGFQDVQRATFRQGRHSTLLVDSQTRACESLYVEAIKP